MNIASSLAFDIILSVTLYFGRNTFFFPSLFLSPIETILSVTTTSESITAFIGSVLIDNDDLFFLIISFATSIIPLFGEYLLGHAMEKSAPNFNAANKKSFNTLLLSPIHVIFRLRSVFFFSIIVCISDNA